MLTVEQMQMVASLKDDISYKILCNHLEEETAGILEVAEDTTDPNETLRLIRMWQASRKIVNRLKTAPETIAEVLRQEEDREKLKNLLQDIEDPFHKPRHMPPPYQNANIHLEK